MTRRVPAQVLRTLVLLLIYDERVDRAVIRAELEAWRGELRAQGRGEDEKVVLGVLDQMSGTDGSPPRI